MLYSASGFSFVSQALNKAETTGRAACLTCWACQDAQPVAGVSEPKLGGCTACMCGAR
jgi:hypothetical protein